MPGSSLGFQLESKHILTPVSGLLLPSWKTQMEVLISCLSPVENIWGVNQWDVFVTLAFQIKYINLIFEPIYGMLALCEGLSLFSFRYIYLFWKSWKKEKVRKIFHLLGQTEARSCVWASQLGSKSPHTGAILCAFGRPLKSCIRTGATRTWTGAYREC